MILIRNEEEYVNSTVSENDIPLSDLTRQTYQHSRAKFSILPAFIRYFDLDSQAVLLERAPEEHIVRFGDKVYELQIPWMLYLFHLDHIADYKIFFNKMQLNDLSDPIYAPPLPNTASDGTFCFAMPDKIMNYQDEILDFSYTHRQIAIAMSFVWDSPFNNYYFLEPSNLPTFIPADVRTALVNPNLNKWDQWHMWLQWWEDNVDLLTAVKWETEQTHTIEELIPQPKELAEDAKAEDAEALIMEFFQNFADSMV